MTTPAFPVIGFTGTKDGLTPAQPTALESLFGLIPGARELHHGDCEGADDAAHRLARAQSWRVVVHPPVNQRRACGHMGDVRLPPKGFMERDDDIAVVCDLLVACPKEADEQLRSGTWATIRRGRRRGKPIAKILPDGQLEFERPDLPAST